MPNRERPVLDVVDTGYFTKNMFRVTLGGAGLSDLPEDQDGGYLKLRIPPDQEGAKTNVRTYTIRHHSNATLDIDFALHGEGSVSGPATTWALNAKPGDCLEVGGPGPAKPLPDADGIYLLVGDMTALPAIGVNLDALGPEARGHAVIEIQSEEDRQDFDLPPGFEIHWLVNPHPGSNERLLSDFVRQLPWPQDLAYAWAASEFESMRQLRTYLRGERGLGPDRLYISSYWKRGLIEDDHRTVKGDDARAQGV